MKEALRYLQNAKDTLGKTPIEDDYYVDMAKIALKRQRNLLVSLNREGKLLGAPCFAQPTQLILN